MTILMKYQYFPFIIASLTPPLPLTPLRTYRSNNLQAAVELDRQKRSEAKIDELERKLKRYQGDTTSEIQILKGG